MSHIVSPRPPTGTRQRPPFTLVDPDTTSYSLHAPDAPTERSGAGCLGSLCKCIGSTSDTSARAAKSNAEPSDTFIILTSPGRVPLFVELRAKDAIAIRDANERDTTSHEPEEGKLSTLRSDFDPACSEAIRWIEAQLRVQRVTITGQQTQQIEGTQ